ncbi:hypothetical protein [Parapedobacter sp. DT-150]|uniref:hypothetical protein n=1 Tax=Parapedobacter sp. DT-150 TaxID=3396162 RepID=UPI003F19F191
MKKKPLTLISFGTAACMAIGFHIISALPNPTQAFAGAPTATLTPHVALGSAIFKYDLYFGDDGDQPDKPTVRDEQLLAYYGS